MIKYIKNDLFLAPNKLIAHGVNCQGAFGSGVAGIMAQKYPMVRNEYLHKYKNTGWKLGEIQIIQAHDKIIVNCATQYYYGYNNSKDEVYANYWAIEQCMKKLAIYAQENDLIPAIPKIGAGLAGGSWIRISDIINDAFKDHEIHVYHLD